MRANGAKACAHVVRAFSRVWRPPKPRPQHHLRPRIPTPARTFYLYRSAQLLPTAHWFLPGSAQLRTGSARHPTAGGPFGLGPPLGFGVLGRASGPGFDFRLPIADCRSGTLTSQRAVSDFGNRISEIGNPPQATSIRMSKSYTGGACSRPPHSPAAGRVSLHKAGIPAGPTAATPGHDGGNDSRISPPLLLPAGLPPRARYWKCAMPRETPFAQ